MLKKDPILASLSKLTFPPRPNREHLITEAGDALEYRFRASLNSDNLNADPAGHKAIIRMLETAPDSCTAQVLLLATKLRRIVSEPLQIALDMFLSASALSAIDDSVTAMAGLTKGLIATQPGRDWVRAKECALDFLNTHDTRHSFALLYGYTNLAFDEGSAADTRMRLYAISEIMYSTKNANRSPIVRLLESEAAKYTAAASPEDMRIVITGRKLVHGTPQATLDALRLCPESLDFCTSRSFSNLCAQTALQINTCCLLLQRDRSRALFPC